MSEYASVDVVRRAYAMIERGDVLALLDLLTDDVQWSYPGPAAIPFAGARHGHDGVAEFFALLGETVHHERLEPREYVAQGDIVVVLGVGRSRVTSTGRAFDQEWAHVYTLRGGRIATFRAFEDTATLVAALDAS